VSDALTRPRSGKVIAGVCAGIARRFGWSTTTVRILFVLAGLFGAGELAYLILWIVMPKEG
jgi:phage shock protein C